MKISELEIDQETMIIIGLSIGFILSLFPKNKRTEK